MLKFIFMLLFMIPSCFLMEFFGGWFSLCSFVVFLLMMSISLSGGIESLGYMWGYDLLSYGLILLSFWMCSLMIMASASVYHLKYYDGLFVFLIIF